MFIALSMITVIGGYLLGSIPSGVLIVKLSTGKDLRNVESGRTGGTNAMRAAGLWAGLGTAALDILKGAASVWLVRVLMPGMVWMEVLAPLMAILGHNYSIFLVERKENGGLRLRGGAGGAPTVGGALALWLPSLLIVVPLSALILYFVGYASVTTLSVPVIALVIFAYRTWTGASPWQYMAYAIIAEIVLIWALRPNIRRLINGTERLVGFRAKRRKSDLD
jgi:glycerol-3-phosphate acyltransferase PlsY